MESLQTPLNNKLSQSLIPMDKFILRNSTRTIIEDLQNLFSLLDSSQYIKYGDRNKLATAILLAKYFGYDSHNSQTDDFISKCNKSTEYLKIGDRNIIKPYVQYLINNLSQVIKHMDNPTGNDTDGIEDIAGLLEKLDLSPFDKLFDGKVRGINENTRKILSEAGMWRAYPDYGNKMIRVWGTASEEEFKKSIKNEIPIEYIKYIQEERHKVTEVSRVHSGCQLNDEETNIFDFRYYMSPKVKTLLKAFADDNCGNKGILNYNLDKRNKLNFHIGGTMGMFMRKGKTHYLITAAHVLFPELSKMELNSEALETFNRDVGFAIYNKLFDIAIIHYTGKHDKIEDSAH